MDISLSYTEAGEEHTDKIPLIFLHGNGEDSSYFIHQIEFFKKSFHIYAADTRGHGNSPRGSASFTIVQFAEDLLGFMDEHKIAKAHLLGFSDGANIAMQFALKHQERVAKLILNGGNLFPRGMKFTVLFPVVTGYRRACVSAKKNADTEKKAEAAKKAELFSLMVNEPQLTADDLKKITVPSLIIAGTHDMIRKKHTRLIAESIPESKLVFVPGTHFIAAENPDAFNIAVAAFLKE